MNFRSFPQKPRPKKSKLVIGKTKVLEALAHGKHLERIYLAHTLRAPEVETIKRAAEAAQVPVNKVPIEKIDGFNVTNHEGCVAIISSIQYQDLQHIISFVVDKGQAPLLMILDGITDIRNIGALARTALCCGIHALVIPEKGVGALNEEAVITSAGALEKLAVCRVSSLVKTVDLLHENGIKVFGSEMTATKNSFEIDFTEPCAIVMGSEDKGIQPVLMKSCDEQFKIPMVGNFESLNVSVAAGMILYEAMKQRMH